MPRNSQWLIFLIIALGIGMRLTFYGDLGLSVANSDTSSYVDSSDVNLLSWNAFTSYRPFTTNLIYKALRPAEGYSYRALAGYDSGTTHRKISAGFKDIAALQSSLSILAWSTLAWIFASKLSNAGVRPFAAGLTLLLGFSPQAADWDSVMSAESLSISLFVIALGILLWLIFAFHEKPQHRKAFILGLLAFFVAAFFWIFIRDVNAYSLVFLAVLIPFLQIAPQFRKRRALLFIALGVILLFFLGALSARQRPLWKIALTHVWDSDIRPSPANVDFFEERGMPQQGTPEYAEWFEKQAPLKYMQFLLAHPAYTTQKFFRDLSIAFSENMQPYFRANDLPTRPLLIMIGGYLHPKSGTVFFIVAFLLLITWNQFAFQRHADAFPWAWIMTWAFLTATATMFFTIFGDTYGLVRHAFSSIVTYKLLMWMLLLITVDYSIRPPEKEVASP